MIVSTPTQALVRWGGALLELAHYKQGQESVGMIELVGPAADRYDSHGLMGLYGDVPQAIVKLQKALEIDSDRADADWCLVRGCMKAVSMSCCGRPCMDTLTHEAMGNR